LLPKSSLMVWTCLQLFNNSLIASNASEPTKSQNFRAPKGEFNK
jgi:hypothetical protein